MNKYNPNIHQRRSIRLKGYDYSQAGLYFITICCQDRVCRFGNVVDGKMMLNEYGQIAFDEWIKTPEIRQNVELGEFVVMPNHIHGIIRFFGRGELNSPNNVTELNSPNNRGESISPNNITELISTNNTTELNSPNNTTELNSPNNITELNSPNNISELISPNNISELISPNNRGESISPLRGPSQNIGAIVRGYKSSVTKQINLLGFHEKLWQRNYYEHIIRNEQSYQNISNYIITNPAKWKDDKFYKE